MAAEPATTGLTPGAGPPGEAPVRDGMSLVVRLAWGLGDVLLSTSALRRYKELHPGVPIVYQTYAHNRTDRYRLEYETGCPAEMLYHNPDIDAIIDWFDPHPTPALVRDLRYAYFGGPSLDYPIQAHFWENLGLEWTPNQRFDAFYCLQDSERRAAAELLPGEDGPYLVLTPQTGWPGKAWSDAGWADLIAWSLTAGLRPVVLAGVPLKGPPWDSRGVLNLSGQLDIRATGGVLDRAEHAVMTEGGLSNLRFALGRPVVFLTCATMSGLQIWTPPELTTEVRMVETEGALGQLKVHPIAADLRKGLIGGVACEPCMWRRDHVTDGARDRHVPPASIKRCPAGRSLRDMPASVIINALEGARA